MVTGHCRTGGHFKSIYSPGSPPRISKKCSDAGPIAALYPLDRYLHSVDLMLSCAILSQCYPCLVMSVCLQYLSDSWEAGSLPALSSIPQRQPLQFGHLGRQIEVRPRYSDITVMYPRFLVISSCLLPLMPSCVFSSEAKIRLFFARDGWLCILCRETMMEVMCIYKGGAVEMEVRYFEDTTNPKDFETWSHSWFERSKAVKLYE